MLAVVGTVPRDDFPLVHGPALLTDAGLTVDGHAVPVNRGTPALLAAACVAARELGLEPPHAFLAGDTGLGRGSRDLYALLCRDLPDMSFTAMVFHYLQPDVDWHNKVLFAVQSMRPAPLLMADAGFMYAAKMSGQAPEYDLFTPDMGELAFLADETAPHPFYARGFLLAEDNQAPDLLHRAFEHANTARHTLVKGSTDLVARGRDVLDTVDAPAEEAMEAMGGTGDSLTGLAAALIAAHARDGMGIPSACLAAARINRLAGSLTRPTPASRIAELIIHIPEAMARVLDARPGHPQD